MARLRFPRTARLNRAPEFEKLKREGVSFHGKYMVLNVLKGAPSPLARIGIITSRRVGGAVARVRVRRRLRELFRAMRPRLEQGVWLVVVARPHAAKASFDKIQAEWRQLLHRAAIVQDAGCSS